jgi:hypothetical protein
MSAPLSERLRRAELVRGVDALEAFLASGRLDEVALARVLLVADVRGPRPVVRVLDRAKVERDAHHELAPHLAILVTSSPGRVRVFVLGRVGFQVGAARSPVNAPGGVS